MIEQFLVYGIVAGGIYALVALGFGIIYQTTRFLNFAHGAVYTFAAYFGYAFYRQLGMPWPLAFSLACAAAMGVGVACEAVVYRPMRRRGASDLVLLIASLGLYIVLQNVISMVCGDDAKTMHIGRVAEGHKFLGARVTDVQLAIVATSLGLLVLIALVLTQTRFGKALRALANDRELASLSGISADTYILLAYAVGSFLGAVAGIMVSFDTDLYPSMGFSALVTGVVAVIIGGMGSLSGAVLGGLLLGIIENIAVWQLSSTWQDSVAFMVLILFLMFRPYGILGRRPQKAHI